ncbi:MAG: FAD-dependent oxidoreductase [Lentisphaerae bacterium]|jgi:NADPH-dependent 2,4-dienoyl-CoA reductase/sulfur reductase-like enzyme/peroxiredoxin family protein/rhodanese-related sulfurtransferase/TusA-related sulfurtransferase|nr:FAD-dependent oxidoreductase [Lentisphaerota bacterium]MBT5607920.1 FAD-dependent oxidoreductase [Lentisphaerota bacterium]MBT7056560.1 FAD-dependent oxidoreductase [Lentisphaerota bacterium]MBT7846351.1 FAD-dependent oxidoreductase [Lentisphaerota bacterium]
MKLLVIGGVAGGASAAARARRLDETAEIVMFERGEYISFANCGLPYHVGQVIPERGSLMVMTPEKFRGRTNIEVRTSQEVTAIDRSSKTVTVRRVGTDERYTEPYDRLILATGSSPIRPPIPGADDPGVFQLWTIPDMDRILGRVDAGARRAVVIGAGFIGLEVAENLRERGLAVDVVEMLPQVLPTLDHEMTQPLADELTRKGITLHLSRRVTGIVRSDSGLQVGLEGGEELGADLVVMSIGVRPNSELAVDAGLETGLRGGVIVDSGMRTSDPDIFAVGDMIVVQDPVLGQPTMIPLAGPANKQGRIAADNACGRDSVYPGTMGTAIVKIFGLTAASVGHTERRLAEAGREFRKVYLHPASNASYYPGASPLAMKVLFAEDGAILGTQIVGAAGVDKRIDVIATAMKTGLTVQGLEELELAYAPPYASAKDPVNFAGMVAANALGGDTRPVAPDSLPENAFLLDVREPAERELGHIEASGFIPLGQLRDRCGELPRDRPIVAYCKVGLRGYLAERILRQNGFDVYNLSGGWLTWRMFHPDPVRPSTPSPSVKATVEPNPPSSVAPTKHIDVTSLQCPGPVVRMSQEIGDLAVGEVLAVRAANAFRSDLEAWCQSAGHEVLELSEGDRTLDALVRKSDTNASMPGSTCGAAASGQPDRAALVVFSNDLDKVMAAFIIATGLATLGTKVDLFFTFWGLNVLRKERPPSVAKDLLSRMFGFMMPRGARKLALSKMHMMGMGTGMMKHVMRQKNVTSLPGLIEEARGLGVRFIACDMAMNVMGLQREELLDQVDEIAGVAKFAALAKESGTVLFI